MESLETKRKIFAIFEISSKLYNDYYNQKRGEELTEEDFKQIDKLFNELKEML